MIEIKNVVKKFKEKIAVDNVNLTIGDNEIFGILGKNGAGKTTLIRMMTMQLTPTAGKFFYDGEEADKNSVEIKKLIGVVPQHLNFDQDLNVAQNLELHARLFGMEKIERSRRIKELLDYMELSDCTNENIRKLSGGMKRRLLIARALIHKPKFLFLDEPTVALDPQVRRKIWSLIEDLRNEGVTIILTTHYIEEAEKLCQRIAILNKGKLVAEDSPKALCERLGRFTGVVEGAEGKMYHYFQDDATAAEFAANNGDINIRPTNLEDVFLEITGQKADL